MSDKRYYLSLLCHECGWGLCVFEGSDLWQKRRRRKRNPPCPYCGVHSTGTVSSCSLGYKHKWPEIREPVRLQEPRKPISRRLRAETLKKYGGACAICGATENLQIDHIIPVRSNGTNAAENLQVLCKSCNASKSDGKSISKWRAGEIEYQKIKRESIIQIKQSCSHLTSKKQVSLKEISRVSGVEYTIVLDCRDEIRKELGLPKKKSSNTPEKTTVVT